MTASDVEVVGRAVTQLGESPRWDPRTQQLVWLDLRAPRAWSLAPSNGEAVPIDLDRHLTALGMRAPAGWVATDDGGFVVLDALAGPSVDLQPIEPDPKHVRMNDGNVGPDGCFWAGSASTDNREARGSLYRLSPDGRIDRVVTGLHMSNGIGWPPEGDRIYLVDSTEGALDVLTVDDEGGLVSRERLVEVPRRVGLPDGLAVDADGGIWVAIWGAGAVHRYAPSGKLDRVVRVPASRTTACAFGGTDLGTLFITTAVRGSALDREPPDPLGGRLFSCRPGVQGLPPNLFGSMGADR
jgi:sugar lactone lactonase YvrE